MQSDANATDGPAAERVKALIVELLGVDAAKVVDKATFEDLGADSLDTVEIVMAIEEEFGIQVTDEAVEQMHTVGDVVDFVVNNT